MACGDGGNQYGNWVQASQIGNFGGVPVIPESCEHGDPDCECLDGPATGIDLSSMVNSVTVKFDPTSTRLNALTGGLSSSTVASGTSVPIGGGSNLVMYPQNPPMTAWPPPPVTGCPLNGHRVVHDPILDDEGVLTGICEDCLQTIRFTKYEPAFDFEQAGIILGRAISIDIEDPENVGDVLAQLAGLRSEIERHMKRYEAAQDLLDIAAGIVQKRALHDTATAVDAA